MKVSMDASQFKLPEANQAFKQGQKVKDFGFKNVVRKSEKESEFGMQDVGKKSEKGSGFGFQDAGQKGGTINVFA
jgi:hypothetical protein